MKIFFLFLSLATFGSFQAFAAQNLSFSCQQAVKKAYEIDDAKGPTVQSAQAYWKAVETCEKDLSPDGIKKFQILKTRCEKKWESESGSMYQSFEAACEIKALLKLIP